MSKILIVEDEASFYKMLRFFSIRKIGKLLTGRFLKLLYGINVHDVLNGFRAVRVSTYPQIIWHSTDYCVEAEMLAWAGKAKLK